ncbi:hypothetical protein [Burkholderia sp. NLJ2]|uniref:hypothetical protein n=1 Tax=Burkholderia sp. NLJ2 TaxID=3090699 RepID=UPI003C6C62E4
MTTRKPSFILRIPQARPEPARKPRRFWRSGCPPRAPVPGIVAFSRSTNFCARELPVIFLIDNLRHIQMTGCAGHRDYQYIQ